MERPEIRTAFLLGAMGPDMGFVPGVDRLVSELSHYVRTADLTRAILDEAGRADNGRAEIAFAWGWATHHLTDVEIHPLVGKACGEHLYGDPSLRLNSRDDLETHVAMEVGLDMVFLATNPSIPRPPATPLARPDHVAFLVRALERTYGIDWSARDVARHHRKATLRTARWPTILEWLGKGRDFAPGWPSGAAHRTVVGPLLDVAHRIVPAGGAASGFLKPIAPPDWLVAEVREVAEAFADRFDRIVESRMETLENRNLETGLLEDEPQDHPDAEETRERLRRLRSSAGSGP